MKTYKMLHDEMWQWLADNPDKNKSDWPEWEWNGGTYTAEQAYYPACMVAQHINKSKSPEEHYCWSCPLKTYVNVLWYCNSCNSWWDMWNNEEESEERTRLALIIKNSWTGPDYPFPLETEEGE